MKKGIIIFMLIGFGMYTIILAILYFKQEALIFFPHKLSNDYVFNDSNSEEIYISVEENVKIHGLLCKSTQESKGVVFYLHGNAGSLASWKEISSTYTNLGYDIFLLDYRAYGKSQGKISSEQQFFSDVQKSYDVVKTRYPENKITIIGYSIGTGSASWLAAKNSPKQLILKAPYYSLVDLTKQIFPFIPSFVLKYKFETYKYLPKVKVPICIFHGEQDEVIYFESSIKLKKIFTAKDKFIPLPNQSHNGINDNPLYLKELEKLLK